MAGGTDFSDFVSGFVLEAEEHLHSVNRNLVATAVALKKGLPDPRSVRDLFRSLHTIKGLASMVGADPIVELSHEMESLLRLADRAGGRLPEASLDLLVQGTRAIDERVRSIARVGVAQIAKAPAALLEALGAAQDDRDILPPTVSYRVELPPEILRTLSPSDREEVIQASKAGRRTVLIDFQPSPERATAGFNITTLRESLGKLGQLVKVVPHSAAGAPTGIAFFILLVTDQDESSFTQALAGSGASADPVRVVGEAPPASTVSTAPGAPEAIGAELSESAVEAPVEERSSIRVDVKRLDDALERLSALVVTRFKMARAASDLAARGVDTRELDAVIAENARQLKRLRAAVTEARMVSLSELLQRLPLVVRGLTKTSGKQVNVILDTGPAEVDKAVADKLFPAVVHMVRNAVDHALESPAERRAAGKPEAGTLTIVCDGTSGTNLTLTITDDGRGIGREAVARKAGVPPARSNDELLQQIATPGLSTRENVSQTSGRGMGMDIVKRTVEVLGGSMSLETTEGRGTTFKLRVPVSVTIVDVFSFVAGGQVFVAPVAMIDEIVEVDPAGIVNAPAPLRRGSTVSLMGRRSGPIPLFDLEEALGGVAGLGFSPKALVVHQSAGAVAFGVDRMLGQQEVVVRPLDDSLQSLPGIAGATDLGDGLPTLVLDLVNLGVAVSKDVRVAG